MESHKIKTHTDLTGKMTIEIPTEIKDSDIEAIIVYKRSQNTNDYNGWLAKLNDLYGSTKDAPIEEPEEIPYNERDELL